MRAGIPPVLAALVLAGCSAPAPAEGGVSADGLSATVLMQDVRFQPADITVKAGARVAWPNVGSLAHTVTSTDGGPLDSGPVPPDDRYEFTFRAPGSYAYRCVPHSYRDDAGRWQNMVGVVTVLA